MNELKLRRETENPNELQDLKNLLNNLNLNMDELQLDRPQADNRLNNRLELRKPDVRPKELNNFKEFDKKYLEKLKVDLKECNPNYNLGRQWKINCQRCVPTFEMRRRGLNVTTLPREGLIDRSRLSQDPFLVWENPKIINARDNGVRDIENHMAKWGDGARAEIVVMWKGSPSGHAFFAERVNGKVHFYDPQNGSMDVSKYFDRVEPGSVRFCRVDNLQPSEKVNDCYRRV